MSRLYFPRSFSTLERILFARRLATFLNTGIPMLAALALIEEHAPTRLSLEMSIIRNNVANGRTLAEALPLSFDRWSITLVRIGETSGTLKECLFQLADSLGKRRMLRRKIASALIYPCLVVCATLGVVVFLIAFAFPKILPVLAGFKGTLPLSTRIVISASDALVHYGWLILVCIAILASAYFVLMRRESARGIRDRILLRLPLIGSSVRTYELASSAHALWVLLGAGTRFVPALSLTAENAGSLPYRDAYRSAAETASEGNRLSHALAGFPNLFPLPFRQLVAAGEASGSLAESFHSLALLYEEELDDLSRNLSSLIEPVLMIVMGLLVGFVALSIIEPIYRITEDIQVH